MSATYSATVSQEDASLQHYTDRNLLTVEDISKPRLRATILQVKL